MLLLSCKVTRFINEKQKKYAINFTIPDKLRNFATLYKPLIIKININGKS